MRRQPVSRGYRFALAASLLIIAGLPACSFEAPEPYLASPALAFHETPATTQPSPLVAGNGAVVAGMPWLGGSGGAVLSPPGAPGGTQPASAMPAPASEYVDWNLPWLRPEPPKPTRPAKGAVAVELRPRPPAPAAGDADAMAPLPKAALAASADGTAPRAVHLASYRSRAAAMSGWEVLRGQYPQTLAAAHPIFEDADLGDKGRFVRLLAGPFDDGSARSVCRNILARGGWCRQVSARR